MKVFKQISAALVLTLWAITPTGAQESTSEKAIKAFNDFFKFDVPYVPTPPEVVEAMLELAEAGPEDTVYDLGSGDGRIVIAAVRDFGVKKGVGMDLDKDLIAQARTNAKSIGIDDRAEFHISDIFATDFSDATILTLYLLEKINVQLRPRILDELRPGTRVVSHQFSMRDWIPDVAINERGRRIYMWIVPAKMAGTWTWSIGGEKYSLELTQKFQEVFGTLKGPGGTAELNEIRVRGTALDFETDLRGNGTAIPIAFKGINAGDTTKATVTVNGQTHTLTAMRTP